MVPIPVDLGKLTDVVRKDVVKKIEYDELVKTFNAIQTTDTTDLVKKADYNTKIVDIERNNLIMPVVKILLHKEFNKLPADNFAARLKIVNLENKNDITNFVRKKNFDEELKSYNKKVTSNETKHLLVENELDGLSEEVKLISTKGLIDNYNILTVENILVEMDHKII